jgi:hypothetical protein
LRPAFRAWTQHSTSRTTSTPLPAPSIAKRFDFGLAKLAPHGDCRHDNDAGHRGRNPLGGNPIEHITNTRKVGAVYLKGVKVWR